MDNNLTFVDSIINGVNLHKAADVVIMGIEDIAAWDVNTLKDGNIIFCKTDFIVVLFDALRYCDKSVKLITHCSDYPISQVLFEARPPCIKKWFAQNADYKHPDLIPVPIGIENHKGICKGRYTNFDFLNNIPLPIEEMHYKIYCNFNRNTHPKRHLVWDTLNQSNRCVMDTQRPFADYCKEMRKYVYVASPRGNGIDCHRTWEALLMGCIPIVEQHLIYDSFEGLPIIQTAYWSKVEEAIINSPLDYYWNYMKYLSVNYWIKLIKEYKI